MATAQKTPTRVVPDMTFRKVIADCNALWRVVRSKGRGVWECVVVDEPFEHQGNTYSSDFAGKTDVFKAEDILAAVNLESFFENSLDESDRWYKSLPIGSVIHYDNGFGKEMIRCEVVDEEFQGRWPSLKPIALVGKWAAYDLPRRMRDGSINNGLQADKVLEGKVFRPHATSMYECPNYAKKGKGIIDPRKMEPIALELPPMTAEEEKEAALWQAVNRAVACLQSKSTAPRAILKETLTIIEAALTL